ncbi:MAG: hypothetical protein OER22_03140 [Gammaproteobacteria bacterium]|nr:hypothetical protein [Gammaproteobacteria bacterium]MDH3371849.1 hypothetical protein [Gammaproteobacteria bacterium]MDH3407822.1 hypothetical protein [Gammaproteobacteria bacterium]MDH3551588.1 hypothetical protein [Gammaproteobacteria bacterium]
MSIAGSGSDRIDAGFVLGKTRVKIIRERQFTHSDLRNKPNKINNKAVPPAAASAWRILSAKLDIFALPGLCILNYLSQHGFQPSRIPALAKSICEGKRATTDTSNTGEGVAMISENGIRVGIFASFAVPVAWLCFSMFSGPNGGQQSYEFTAADEIDADSAYVRSYRAASSCEALAFFRQGFVYGSLGNNVVCPD